MSVCVCVGGVVLYVFVIHYSISEALNLILYTVCDHIKTVEFNARMECTGFDFFRIWKFFV
jgi:hypothetical protein